MSEVSNRQPNDHLIFVAAIHYVSKNDTRSTCYNFNIHEPITIILGRNGKENKQSQDVLFVHLV